MEIKDIKTYQDLKIALTTKKVTGYIWMVEHDKPKVYNDNNKIINFEVLDYGKNPHNKIQEAYLYVDKTSIHIKNIDGEEKFYVLSEESFKGKEFNISKEIEFPSHIITGKNLKFKQVYELKESLSGTDFKTWQPIVRLFVGLT